MTAIEIAREIAGWVLLLSGSAFLILTGIGLLRLPNFYTRIHAASMSDTAGAGLVLLGLVTQAGFSLLSAKLLLILAFMALTGPAAAHALAKAAYLHGLDPKLGAQRRPGRRRQGKGGRRDD